MTMPGHQHGGKSHLLGMLGVGGAVLVVLLAAGRPFGEALPLAAALACPVMMIGMVVMAGRHGRREESACHHSSSEALHTHARAADAAPDRLGPARRHVPPGG